MNKTKIYPMKAVERENFVEFTRKYFALRTILKIQKI